MLQLIVKLTDTHANLNVAAQIQPPTGTCQLPVFIRFIGKRAVVTGYSEPTLGLDTGLKRGDVIESLDGEAVDSWSRNGSRTIPDRMRRPDCKISLGR